MLLHCKSLYCKDYSTAVTLLLVLPQYEGKGKGERSVFLYNTEFRNVVTSFWDILYIHYKQQNTVYVYLPDQSVASLSELASLDQSVHWQENCCR
jgi:hypothetical protein